MFEYNVCEEMLWTQIEAALREYKDEILFAEAVYASDDVNKVEQVIVLD